MWERVALQKPCVMPTNPRGSVGENLSLIFLLGNIPSALNMDETLFCCATPGVSFNDECGKLATLDAAGIEALGVLLDLESCLCVVAVDDGATLVLRQVLLVVVPVLW